MNKEIANVTIEQVVSGLLNAATVGAFGFFLKKRNAIMAAITGWMSLMNLLAIVFRHQRKIEQMQIDPFDMTERLA